MLLLISDANILIDMECGGLTASMFSLGYRFAVPDVLYYEELEVQHQHLLAMGLEIHTMDSTLVERVEIIAQQHVRPSRNDLFALVLAEYQKCTLLTGDEALRAAAQTENIEVKGTLWLVEEMVRNGQISNQIALSAYERMKLDGRRLPWDLAKKRLQDIETDGQT